MPKFDDEENKKLNKGITNLVKEMTNDLQECENIIKEINIDTEINNNQIKQNIKQSIYTKITDFTKKYKVNQELYSEKYKDFVGEEEPSIHYSVRGFNFLMSESDNTKELRKRDNELNSLLNNVNDLASLFKDMQNLVMEQGTILDRIDYNIDVAGINVAKGKKSIIKANEYQKNNCFRNITIILLVCIFIECILLIFKFI